MSFSEKTAVTEQCWVGLITSHATPKLFSNNSEKLIGIWPQRYQLSELPIYFG